jgi:hypothetical protein
MESRQYAGSDALTITDAIGDLTDEVRRLNDNLEAGRVQVRTHHPLCLTPNHSEDYTVSELELIGKFLSASITAGTLVLPERKKGGAS